MTDLRHIESWIFDLDNTLYEAQCQLFAQIDARMTDYIRTQLDMPHEEARFLQKDYYVRYGTTMSGLMTEHNVDPDHFLHFVHDIDLTPIKPNPALAAALSRLPGKKYIFTNGSVTHAANVAGALGIFDQFEDVFDIKAAGYTPKPKRKPYELFLEQHEVTPNSSIMFEDIAQNLEMPHAMGMTTVLVCSNADWLEDEPISKRPAKPGETADHIHHSTNDLTDFLNRAVVSKNTTKPA